MAGIGAARGPRPTLAVGASGFIAGVLVLLASDPARGQTPGAAKAEGTALPLPTERWTGDLDQRMKRRSESARRGLGPNVWFDNVERMTAERMGRETVTCVSRLQTKPAFTGPASQTSGR